MNLKLFLSVLPLFITQALLSQPATEVYLFDLSKESLTVANPVNVSSNPGRYDNQPSFSLDGRTLYFVSQDAEGQNDIYFYNIKKRKKSNFSATPASEYSPTPTPDGQFVSCIRVVGEEQLLWKFPLKKGEPMVVIPELVVGYHAWQNNQTVVSFVLGEPQTLQVSDLTKGTHMVVASNPGRSIHKIPGSGLISFLQNRPDQPPAICSLDVATGQITTLAEGLEGSQDMAWLPDGRIVMGQGSKLMVWSDKQGWKEVADLQAAFGLSNITRLAVNGDGSLLAVVIGE